MRKTNSKEVKTLVRQYILDCVSGEMDSLTEVKDKFISEYGWSISRCGDLNSCIEWLRGLGISVDFYYSDMVKLLAYWLDDTEDNQWKWIDKKGDGLYWLLIAREIVNAK